MRAVDRGCVHESDGGDRDCRVHVYASDYDVHVHDRGRGRERDHDRARGGGDRVGENAHGASRPLAGTPMMCSPRRTRAMLDPGVGVGAARRPAAGKQKKFDRQDHGHAHSSGRTTARAPTPPVPTARVPRTPQGFLRRRVDLQGRTAAALQNPRQPPGRVPEGWLLARGPPARGVCGAIGRNYTGPSRY